MTHIPTVIEISHDGERHYDVYSLLLKERIIMLTGEIDDITASNIIAQLLYLSSKDANKDIQLYINSVGGSITSGMAIYDTMQYINCDIVTICVGMAASMGAFLLSGGKKGKRFALENSEIMIHQPSGGASGVASDIEIASKRIIKLKEKINRILALNTCQSIEKIIHDTERDYFMDANEALKYGIIDKIIKKSSQAANEIKMKT
ncbi:MAG: ATP-dependent Clp protease proteolytic subunit [Erysipelotrichaceae bacterium]|nr:ATP-dependent Clp protease proteolytic subunit [Erysipelotrichaceae bacterium]